MAEALETPSIGSGDVDTEEELPDRRDDASQREVVPEASEKLDAFPQDAQSWRWEQRWVNIERSFVSPLRLRKWVRIQVDGTKRPRPRPIDRGKDGAQRAAVGFREYCCTHPGCGKIFNSAGSLRKHTHIHGEKQFICPVAHCGKRFLDNSKLKRHMRIHFRDTVEQE